MYVNSNAGCSGNAAMSFLRHAVTLGIYCALSTEPFYFYGDQYVECGNYTNNFDLAYEMYGIDTERYMCSSSATFPAGSVSAFLVIPDVSIVTDDRWLVNRDKICYTSTTSNIPPSAPTASTVAPIPVVLSPVSVSSIPIVERPIISPTQRPFDQPVDTAMNIPVAPRQIAPVEPALSSSTGTPIGAVVGGIIGGMAVVCLLVIIFLMSRRKTNATAPGGHNKPINTTHYTNAQSVSATGASNDHDTLSSPTDTRELASNGVASISTYNSNSHPPFVPQTPMNTTFGTTPALVVTPQPHYAVNYKDQARTVIIPSVVTPVQTEVPMAMAMEVSATSAEGSSRTSQAEPPGRHFVDM
jgi:hypothetical protein